MYYDALTLAAVKDELCDRLLNGRVQRIVQPSQLTLGLEVYAGQRHQVLLSAESRSPGVWLAESKLRRGTEVSSPLSLLLLKYVRGARLEALEQPPLERVLRFKLGGEFGPVHLVCEIMGRYSNIILLGPDDVIMESIKRVPPTLNRYRTILPRQPYVPPPAQQKAHPLGLTLAGLRAALAGQSAGPLWERLLNALSGISPILAREIAFRATGALDPVLPLGQEAYARLLVAIDALMHLPETHAWSPCIAFAGEGEERHVVAHAPYELTHMPDREPAPSICEAIQRVLEAQATFDAYGQVRARLHGMIEQELARQRARLAALQRSLVPAAEMEALQQRANAILALAWAIKPGQRELVVDPAQLGMEASAASLRIALDPKLSPSENAQKLYRDYHKMKAAGREVPQLIAGVELELAYLQQLNTEVDLAENRLQLDEVERELREAGLGRAPDKGHGPTGKSQPLSVRAEDGILILVGRNSQQNDEVTFRRGGPDDIWLHAHGVPGSHVVIQSEGRPVRAETLEQAARLAAYYSAARQEARVQVDYAARRHVRHIKGGRPGMVTYTHEQTLVVAPEMEE